MNSSIEDRRTAFRALHAEGCFLLPNPWDVGSARWLEARGFKALATTSSGFAFSRGRPDGGVPVETVLAHCREIVHATNLPVNADFEDGHAADLAGLRENVKRCVATGVAALSIEDSTGDRQRPLYPIEEAVERMKAARAAIDETGANVMLIGRAECFFVGTPDPLPDAVRRLRAYSAAGADCLYAPGLASVEQIAAVVAAVAPKPVNVLLGPASALSLDALTRLGVRRISTGGSLALSAWSGFIRAADALHDGVFDKFDHLARHGELARIFEHQPSLPFPGE